MKTPEDVKREIVNHELRIENLLKIKDQDANAKIDEIRSQIVALKHELLNWGEIKNESSHSVTFDHSFEENQKRIAEHNKNLLSNVYSERYSKSYYFMRKDVWSHFKEFLSSSKTVMGVIGKAGSGKSMLLCNLVDAPPENSLIILIDCKDINQDSTRIDSYLDHKLNLEGTFHDFVHMFVRNTPEKNLVLLFDSINENSAPKSILLKLSKLINSMDDPRVKIVFSCRIPIWHSIKSNLRVPYERVYHVAGPDSFVSLDKFSIDEIKTVYENYKNVFSLQSEYHELSEQVRFFLANPLFMRLSAEVYCENQQKIPGSLALRDVFSEYILNGLGPGGYNSEEYKVLQRVIELMYEKAKSELAVAILQADSVIGTHILAGFDSPYAKLLDEGILSEKVDIRIIRRISKVFVTYERVFEYLLAEILVGDISSKSIIDHLEMSRAKDFLQLRGAVELAVSFKILQESNSTDILTELASLGRADTRQFFVDVVHTISESGNSDLAKNIILEASDLKNVEAKLIAVHAAYALGFDEHLIRTAIANDENLSGVAAFFLYERWNNYRKMNNLDSGYEVLSKIIDNISFRNLSKSLAALKVLLSIATHMLIHVIEDVNSLVGMVGIYEEIMKKIPGSSIFANQDKKSGVGNIGNFIIDLSATYAFRVSTYEEALVEVLNDKKSLRAMIDVGELTLQDSLLDYEEEIIVLMSWPADAVCYFAGSLITHQLYFNPDSHSTFFLDLLSSDKLSMQTKCVGIRAFSLGLAARLLHEKDIPENSDKEVYVILDSILTSLLEKSNNWDNISYKHPSVQNPMFSWKAGLFGLLVTEALLQQRRGNIIGSRYLSALLGNPMFRSAEMLNVYIEVLEKVSYQGYIEFALLSILSTPFIGYWQKIANSSGVECISRIRGLFQREVDSLLRTSNNNQLWEDVSSINQYPNMNYIHDISVHMWSQVAIATSMIIEKTAGLMFLEFADSNSPKEAMRRVTSVAFQMIESPIVLDIAHYQWGIKHDKNMVRAEKLGLPSNIQDIRPDLHEKYASIVQRVIGQIGLGILHKNDNAV